MKLITTLTLLSLLAVTLTLAQHGVGPIQLDMDIDDTTISLAWRLNSTDNVYGYKVVIRDADDINLYESPVLNKHADGMVLKEELEEGDISVCLLVLMNSSHTVAVKCEEVTGTGSMQMVIGILAGVVFLVPCVSALIFIIYKDRQVLKRPGYDPSETKILIKPGVDVEAVIVDNEKPQSSKATEGKVNECYEAELESIDLESETRSEKSDTSQGSKTELTKSQVNTTDTKTSKQTEGKVTAEKDSSETRTEIGTGKRNSSKKSSVFVIKL